MPKQSKAFPIFITILTPLIFFGVMRAGYQQNIGPVCDLNENFASPNRPAYAHHCKCLGIRYFESPTATRPPGSNATRCFGQVRRSWTDTDEAALKEVQEHERQARSAHGFEKLAPEAQDRIRATYRQLQQAAFRHDYPRMKELANGILLEVDDYGDTRAMDAVARKSAEVPADHQ
ncbi:MAG: hypothetical protein ACXVCS_22670 [Bdellovibrionota bacterium]